MGSIMFDQEEIKSAVISAIAEKVCGASSPSSRSFVDGEHVLIRSVTTFSIGRVIKENQHFVWLDGASWVADTGRYAKALLEGAESLDDVEMSNGVKRVAIGAIVDVDEWKHPLPKETK